MSSETTWKCDVGGEYRDKEELTSVLVRDAGATTQNFTLQKDVCDEHARQLSVYQLFQHIGSRPGHPGRPIAEAAP